MDKVYAPVLIHSVSCVVYSSLQQVSHVMLAGQAALLPGHSWPLQPHRNQHQDKTLASKTQPKKPSLKYKSFAFHVDRISGSGFSNKVLC